MKIRDRIRELRRVKAGDLVPHPKNWRVHPDSQRNALRGVLSEIGYADALLVRELSDGRFQLIDGHLRAETTPAQKVPVLVVDLDDAETDKLLATLDPLAGLAHADPVKLDALLEEVDTKCDSLRAMLSGLAERSQAEAVSQRLSSLDEGDEPGEDQSNDSGPPPERWAVLIECKDKKDRTQLLRKLRQQGLPCHAVK